MPRIQVRYKQMSRGYILRGLREIACACNVSRPVLLKWIAQEQFPVAPITIGTPSGEQRILATTYGLIDTWLFARYLACHEALKGILDEASITEEFIEEYSH